MALIPGVRLRIEIATSAAAGAVAAGRDRHADEEPAVEAGQPARIVVVAALDRGRAVDRHAPADGEDLATGNAATGTRSETVSTSVSDGRRACQTSRRSISAVTIPSQSKIGLSTIK